MSSEVQKNYLSMLKKLILLHLGNRDIQVILFGSHAKNTTHRYSDIDIALLSADPLPLGLISQLKEKIEQSIIPYSVDIIDLSQVDRELREKVIREGIVWKD